MAPTDRYRRTTDLPPAVPVFPLRGAILLPRTTLPLQVFEPRYLAMLDEVMSTSRVLGIVQPDRSDDTSESPRDERVPLRSIGRAGRVTSYKELDDGRMLIALTGIARFEIVSERENEAPFRTCDVSYAHFSGDLEHGAGEDQVDRDALLAVLKTYLTVNRLDADWKGIAGAPTELLVNALSVMSPFGTEEKQALLEASDLASRARVLMTLAQMEISSNDSDPSGTLQ